MLHIWPELTENWRSASNQALKPLCLPLPFIKFSIIHTDFATHSYRTCTYTKLYEVYTPFTHLKRKYVLWVIIFPLSSDAWDCETCFSDNMFHNSKQTSYCILTDLITTQSYLDFGHLNLNLLYFMMLNLINTWCFPTFIFFFSKYLKKLNKRQEWNKKIINNI